MILKRNNVERKADSKEVAEKLKQQGYKEVTISLDLRKMKIPELRERAKEKGIEGYEDMRRDELIKELYE